MDEFIVEDWIGRQLFSNVREALRAFHARGGVLPFQSTHHWTEHNIHVHSFIRDEGHELEVAHKMERFVSFWRSLENANREGLLQQLI